MTELRELSEWLEKELKNHQFAGEPSNLYDPLRYFMTLGGKRMRPLLTLIAAEMFGSTRDEALPAAMAIEFFHNFSLIHDDIMDEAPLRRGQITVHERWNENIAILSGDVLYTESFKQLCNYGDERLPELLKLFTRTAEEVCQGQQLDMDFESEPEVSLDRYVEMIRLKTSVLLGCALEMGAIVARCSEEDRKALYQFGVELGIAFQIQDDLLDLFGNPETFGKQIGGDILSNKKTYLYLTAMNMSTVQPALDSLKNILDPEEKVDLARQLFETCGAYELTLRAVQQHYLIALQSLEKISSENKKVLRSLAASLLQRVA